MAGMDGNRAPPGRLSSAPQTVLKTAGGTSPRTSPTEQMLFRQRDADALDPEGLRMARQQSDQEPEYSIDRRGAGDRGHQRRFGRAKGAQLAVLGDARKAPRSGLDEGDPDFRVPLSGMDQRQRVLAPDLPGPDLLALDPPLQGGQEALPPRVLARIDRNLHGRTIATLAPPGEPRWGLGQASISASSLAFRSPFMFGR